MSHTPRDLRRLEGRLRSERPQPSRGLVAAFAPRRQGAAVRRQLAFASALTAILLVALAAVGGVSYAANAVGHAVQEAAKVVTPQSHHSVRAIDVISSGGDQYRPGYGFGDPNHNHTGPPGLTRGKDGEKAPPAQTTHTRKADLVSTSITVDEQAALYFSVLGEDGKPLLLTQKGSKFGKGHANGKQTKSIHYVMLVPRTLTFALRIPSNLLVAGHTYKIRVIAVDADGNRSTSFIPFTA
jgi:hypothetical protein